MNLGKKFGTVLIILFLCLSPLGAIDLHQWDNSSHLNDLNDLNDGSHLNDLNGTDIEIESINETDESINGNDVESQNLSINDSNSSKSLKRKNLNLVMEVDDTTYGEAAVVKIGFKNDDFGYAMNPKVIVEDSYTYEVYTKDYFSRGCNEIKLRNDLTPGTYTVTYKFNQGTYWEPKTVTDTFTVNKKNPNLKASVEDVYVGENPVVKVSTNEDVWGEGWTHSPQFTKDYYTHFCRGEANCTIDEDLPAGNYTCTVSYDGDFIYANEDLTVNFAVNKQDPNLTVQVDDVTVNDPISIKIRANESVNGEVEYYILPYGKSGTVVIDPDEVHNATLVNGVGSDLVETDLAPGKYEIFATYKGDDSFKEVTVSSAFDVTGDSNNFLNVCKNVLVNG